MFCFAQGNLPAAPRLGGRGGVIKVGRAAMDALEHPPDVERSDADSRLIAALALGLGAFILASPYLLRALYPAAIHIAAAQRDLPRPRRPVLEVHPRATLEGLRSREDALLDGYGSADQKHGVARIPIERAMELVATRGLAGWPSGSTAGPARR